MIGGVRQSKNHKANHFYAMSIDGKKVFESEKVPGVPAPQWATQMIMQSRFPGFGNHVVAKCSAGGADFLESEGAETQLVNNSGKPFLAVKFDISTQSHYEFMKALNADIVQLAKFNEGATTICVEIFSALVAMVPVIDRLGGIAQNQKERDDIVGDLLASLRDIAGVTQTCPDLDKIEGSAEDFRKVSLEAAIIVHDYVDPSKIPEHEIHKWMEAPDTSVDYNMARKKHQPGTGRWFLDGSEFSGWKEQPGSVLWLCGGPGSGKTILCSSAIADIIAFCEQKPSARGYAYFFFDSIAVNSQISTYNAFARSIISQLSDRCGDRIPTVLEELYSKCNSGYRQPLEVQLESTLARIIENFHSTYIIIDALDECTEKADILKWIHSVASKTSRYIHLMLASRPDPDIEHALASLPNLKKVAVAAESTVADINTYIDAELACKELSRWNKEEKQMIKDVLVGSSDGMIRYVWLKMEAVKACTNRRQLEAQLNSLPRYLEDSYAQIFARSTAPDDLLRLLQWLAFAERPLTVTELADVLTVDFSGIGGPIYNPRIRLHRPRKILGLLNGLVGEHEGAGNINDNVIPESGTYEQFSHSVIAQTCLAQLLYLDGPSILNWQIPGSDAEDLNFIKTIFPLAGWVRLQNMIIDADPSLKYTSSVLGRSIRSFKSSQHLPLDASPLYYACFVGSFQAVQNLVSEGADVNAVGAEASTRPLLLASIEGHIEIAQLLLESGADVNVQGGIHCTSLQAACAGGDFELSKLLLDKGADANIVGGKYGTALTASSAGGHIELSKLLLDKGANVNIVGGEYGAALLAACARGHNEIAKLLLDKGADVNIVGGRYSSALTAASAGGHLELSKLLLDKGADVNIAGGEYSTALTAASSGGHLELSKLLLDRGADIDFVGGEHGTALMAASARGHLELSALLLDRGPDVNAEGGEHGTALMAASARGHLEIARLLLERGADVNAEGGEHGTALMAAAAGGHLDIIQLLLDCGAVDTRREEGSDTAVQTELPRGDFDDAKALPENSADAPADGSDAHDTPLYEACAEGNVEGARLLLDKGVDIDVDGGKYGTALQVASAGGHLEVVKLLLDRKADANVRGERGTASALYEASEAGHLEVAKLLLDKGADANVEGGLYGTALQAACVGGYLELVEVLLENKAAVNAGGGKFGTALQASCVGGYVEVARLLLAKGADVNAH
ncbi:hypothetical protein HWV62_3028 [Athelia sp. TMB]|nr:hypothetical protein HWV62_3028 [Athelia sp. TMB]